ncbi:adenylate/guanylate cyclase domain-containing protein [Methylobacterium sp. WL12]|uniref:adenylate/guanylate cyclase domain-containing protein n=1 Tax=Methylobacterium sp. WL12 TaxID=2603890 RepID=UPI0011CAFFD7|nr:adenylate/guanylate cyclase domain-containing protein [Methylobacterium sp. WL12]TXM71699.1 adenylate/guanylate cyclase domain-containing protein [Methylobacterium sp. WL12]
MDRPLPEAGSRPRGYPVLFSRFLRPRRSHDPRQTDRLILMKRGLTGLSFIITHGADLESAASARTLISLAAIAITTKLALLNIATRERLITVGKEKDNLARFFPPAIVEQIATNDIALSTTRYEPAAVLFVDMIGFTKFCSVLRPQDVIAMLRELLCILSASVFEHHGTVDKFTGDGLIAVFGLPVSNDLSATNAVRCALTMQVRLQAWNDERATSGLEAVAVAIGIHYGDVVLGDVGCESRLELTVLGDTVNVASRVEHHCREARASIRMPYDCSQFREMQR